MKTKTKAKKQEVGLPIDVKVKNSELGILKAVYGQIQYIQFEDATKALKMIREKKRVEQANEDFESLRKEIQTKYGIVEGAKPSQETLVKAGEEFDKFLKAETEISALTPIPFSVIQYAGLTPKQLEVLESLELIADLPALD